MNSSGLSGIIARTASVTVEQLEIPAGVRLRRHDHRHPHLCFVAGGRFEERDLGRTREVTAGTLRRSPAGDRHDIHFRSPTTCLLVVFHGESDGAPRAPVAERHFLESARVAQLAAALSHELREAQYASALQIDSLALELLAASTAPLGRRAAAPPAWLHRIRERIREAPHAPPATADMAGTEGYHPVYVARAFREYFGTGVGEYARRVQAEYAQRLLVQSNESLAVIAASAGYADQSHLTRAMRRHLGATPAALRRRLGRAIQVSSVQDGRAHGT